MLEKAKAMKGYTLSALDGEIGTVKELYFDDKHWVVRYLVVETGSWLSEKQVLISPYAVTSVDRKDKTISVDLTRKQIEDSPALDSDKPVSKQFEDSYYNYYGWPNYWDGVLAWGSYSYATDARQHWDRVRRAQESGDRHLRSSNDVTGHSIEATDGEIGHVEDFVVDDESWAIRYMVVATRNWWPGAKVLISPMWIERISWIDSTVYVLLSRDDVRKSPPYDEEALLERGYESVLHQHYGRDGYWSREPAGSHRTT